jgi:flagella synthesis protein FlgN
MLPLIPILKRNKELLELLLDLLIQERAAFGALKTSRIQEITQAKQEAIDELDELSKKQHQILCKFGVINPRKPIPGAFRDWLSKQDPEDESRILVEECETLLVECKGKNFANERILSSVRRRNQTMLEILKGQNKKHRVYTASGNSRPISSKHIIGSA